MLKGLVSIVTGGASGLGRETVKHLSKNGGRVVSVDLPDSKGQEVADAIGGDVIFVPCDVSSESDVANAMSCCEDKFGRLDLAVSCAGLARAFKIANPVRRTPMKLEDFELIYKVNVYGTFNVTRLSAQLMAKNEPSPKDGERGVIINTGSMSSEDGGVGQTAFSATKAAVTAMTLPVARDLAPLGIRVITISPSLFDTPLTSEHCLTEVVRRYYAEQMVFPKRFGDPAEFAAMVEHIVSNPMLNGENVRLSAGLRVHVDVRVPTEAYIDPRPPLIN